MKEQNKNRIVKNAAWIIGVQIVKALLGIVISMLTARYLGPANFGLINYAASIVAFVSPIMFLGLNNILVQELCNNPNNEGEILGTSICLSFISSLLCIAGVVSFVSIANSNEKETLLVCFLYSLLLVFQSFDLIQYWFQAKLMSKYSSIVSLIAYGIISLYKAFLLVSGKTVFWFAVSNALDYFIISGLLLLIYKRVGNQKLRFVLSTGKRLLSKSKYFIVSNLMIVVFAETDKVMLKLMVGNASTGYYSAAIVCAQLVSFVFTAIIDSFRPVAFEEKEKSIEAFEKCVISLYSIIIYCALFYSLCMTIFSPITIRTLYGNEYEPAIVVLKVIVWYCCASYLGGARDIWILAENKQKHLLVINSVGAFLNVLLNLILIPRIQAVGAAIASVVTQFAINIIFVSIYSPTRRNGFLMLQALKPNTFFSTIHNLIPTRY